MSDKLRRLLFGLVLLILIVVTINWAIERKDARNPYTIENIKRSIEEEIPVGSSKPQVAKWLHAHQMAVSWACFDSRHKGKHPLHDLYGSKPNTRNSFPCDYSLLVSFAFDEKNRLIRYGVQEQAVCL